MPDTEKLVTISRLKALLDAYGAAPECWPEEERAAATALIETSPEARILVEEADALDSLLDKIPEPEVSAALTSRVRSMALPAIEAKTGGMFSRLTDFLRPQTLRAWQGSVAMAGILGIIAGIGVSPLVLDRTDSTPRVVATASTMTFVPAIIASDVEETNTASLAPDLTVFSLTGDEMAENSSDISGDTVNNNDAEPQSDAGEFTIASVPLY